MAEIRNQRTIIDPRALTSTLDGILAEGLHKPKRRIRALEAFKTALAIGQAEIQRRFNDHGDGATTARETCFLIDQLIRTAHDFIAGSEFGPSTPAAVGEAMSLVAVGGYGRGELSPQSDVDLLFLIPSILTPHHEQLTEQLLYMLWDMGLKVGHSTRCAEDCIRNAKTDLTIRTALLEMRWLWGDQALFADLQARFRAEVIANTTGEFVKAKLAERATRHEQAGDATEPNVKEGKGGLRDLQTLFWVARYLYNAHDIEKLVTMGVIPRSAAKSYVKAEKFLWTVRCHLQYLTGHAEDRLTVDVQPEIATRMGYVASAGRGRSVERLMKHFFLVAKNVDDLTDLFFSLAEEPQTAYPTLPEARPAPVQTGVVDGRLVLVSEAPSAEIAERKLGILHDEVRQAALEAQAAIGANHSALLAAIARCLELLGGEVEATQSLRLGFAATRLGIEAEACREEDGSDPLSRPQRGVVDYLRVSLGYFLPCLPEWRDYVLSKKAAPVTPEAGVATARMLAELGRALDNQPQAADSAVPQALYELAALPAEGDNGPLVRGGQVDSAINVLRDACREAMAQVRQEGRAIMGEVKPEARKMVAKAIVGGATTLGTLVVGFLLGHGNELAALAQSLPADLGFVKAVLDYLRGHFG